ncbi:hypothetical protein OPQ81_002955 [Rhizoctonia solani]|nr:hypothetical protein OPQ81_002955 [Rhizoctonia solani]
MALLDSSLVGEHACNHSIDPTPSPVAQREMLGDRIASALPRDESSLAAFTSTTSVAPIVAPIISLDIYAKRNVAFHGLFPNIAVDDYLIEEYGCKLQKENPIGGRLYLSNNHICFFSNIDMLNFVISLHEVTGLEKNTMAHVPNAIQIYTRTTEHTFTSFLMRDAAYDKMHTVWRTSQPNLQSVPKGAEGGRTVGLESTDYFIQPVHNTTSSSEIPSPVFMGWGPETSVSQPAGRSVPSDDDNPSVSAESSSNLAGNNLHSINRGILNSAPVGYMNYTSGISQYPSEVADISQVRSPQHMASIMYECLTQHGCPDLMSMLDPIGFSSSAVAEGGFGDIWTGRLHNDGTKLAIKVLRLTLSTGDVAKKELKRTAREIYNWSKLDHENVHKLMGVVMFRERLGMVSEWMEHGNLRQYLSRNNGVDRHALCLQIARGVMHIHGVNMVHGDLKAFNILVSSTALGFLRPLALVEEPSDGWLQSFCWMKAIHSEIRQLIYMHLEWYTFLETITNNYPYSECNHDTQILLKHIRKEHPMRPTEHFPEDKRGHGMWNLLVQCWDHDPALRPTADNALESLLNLGMKT